LPEPFLPDVAGFFFEERFIQAFCELLVKLVKKIALQ
jgi:hypothetical protein